MAGGMGYRRGTPLRDRPVSPAPGEVRTPPRASRAQQPAHRHCWVRGPDGAPGPHPGLLLEWRSVGEGMWEALVAYAVQEGDRVTLVQQWLSAALVSPVPRAGKS